MKVINNGIPPEPEIFIPYWFIVLLIEFLAVIISTFGLYYMSNKKVEFEKAFYIACLVEGLSFAISIPFWFMAYF